MDLTGNVCLLDALLGEPLCEHVRHSLWRERNGKGEFGFVARHGRDLLSAQGGISIGVWKNIE